MTVQTGLFNINKLKWRDAWGEMPEKIKECQERQHDTDESFGCFGGRIAIRCNICDYVLFYFDLERSERLFK